MNKLKLTTFGILLLVLMLMSCGNPLFNARTSTLGPQEGGARLWIGLQFPSARMIVPSAADLQIDSYSVRMSRRGYPDLTVLVDEARTDEDAGTGFWMENVAPGPWTITVLALNEDGAPIATSQPFSFTVTDSGESDQPIILTLGYYETTGTGGLELSLMIPKGMFSSMGGDMPPITLADVKASLHYESDGSTIALATAILPSGYDGWDMLYVSGSGLKAGAPTLNLSFKAMEMSRNLAGLDGEFFALYSETVWIYRNVVTRATKPIIEPAEVTDFNLRDARDDWFLSWDKVPFATAYKVYTREADQQGEYLLLGTLDVGDLSAYYDWGGECEYDFADYPFSELVLWLEPGVKHDVVMTALYGPYESEFPPDEWAASFTRGALPAPYYVGLYYPDPGIYWPELPGATGYKVWIQSGEDEPVLLQSLALDDPDLFYESELGNYEYYLGTEAARLLMPGYGYQFSVSAVFPYGFESEPSQPVWYYPWIANVIGFNLTWDAWPEATGYNIWLRQELPVTGAFEPVVSLSLGALEDYWNDEDRVYRYNFLNDLEATYDDGKYGLYISAILGEDEGEEILIATTNYYGSGSGFGNGSGFFGSNAGQ
jgi:hypothetical protein